MFALFTWHHLGGQNNIANAHALKLEKYLLYLSFNFVTLFTARFLMLFVIA